MKKLRKFRVMMVDDSATLRALLNRTLKGIDHSLEVLECASGDEVLEYPFVEAIDIFLLDINMPGKDGIETLIALKEKDPDCFVVMVTANQTNEWVIKAKKSGANGYIIKPFNADKLVRVLDDCVRYQELLVARAEQKEHQDQDVVEL